jgi:lysozyme
MQGLTKKVIIISVPVFALGCFFLIWGYLFGYWRFNYPPQWRYPVRGIDISHHQGAINWEQVKRNGIDFVYMKATEGGDHKDREFPDNWRAASRIGLVKGAYHFFTFCTPGSEQAANFIATVPREPNTLPPAIDCEFSGNCKARPKKETVAKELTVFIRAIEKRYGQSPIFYVTYDSYEAYIKGAFPAYHVWIRDIYAKPQISDRLYWTFWQYANRGHVKGIRGLVDLDVFNGDNEAFMALTQQTIDTSGTTHKR